MIHGANHVLKATCTGSLLIAKEAPARCTSCRPTLRDAKYDSSFHHGAALEATKCSPVQLDQSVIENNNAVIGAGAKAKSLVANDTQFLNNGTIATNLGFGAGGCHASISGDGHGAEQHVHRQRHLRRRRGPARHT